MCCYSHMLLSCHEGMYLPKMHRPFFARVMATFTWLGSVMKPRCFPSQDLLCVGRVSSTEGSQERTVERMTYGHSLPTQRQIQRSVDTSAACREVLQGDADDVGDVNLTLAFHDGTHSHIFNLLLSEIFIDFRHLSVVWC